MALRQTSLSLVLSAAVIACTGEPIGPAERSAERVWFYATGLSLAPGDTARMGVTAADSAVTNYVTFPDYSGNPWPADLHIRWWTSDSSRATVDSSGLVTARAVGQTTIWVGVGTTVDSGTVIVATDPSSGLAAQAVAGGLGHTCGLSTTGQAYCWGSDFSGALGRGQLRQFNSAAVPSAVSGGRHFASLAVGGDFACALTAAGAAYCWGGNEYGQLGDGTDASAFSEIGGFGRAAPVAVLGGKTFTSLYVGGFHVCALDADARASCWGWHGLGQLAVGPYEGPGAHRSAPSPAADSLRFLSLALGALHTCGIGLDSITYCWGLNDKSQLGIDSSLSPDRCGGGSVCSIRPIALDSTFRFTAVTAGRGHTCGLTTSGVAYCWGNRSPIPTAVTGPAFVRITAGTHHTCGLTAAGAAYCWGENDYGQLGDGTSLIERPDPVAVATALKFVSLDAGFWQTCGVGDDGWAYCWGRNLKGEIGNGTMQAPNAATITTVLTPARVRAPIP